MAGWFCFALLFTANYGDGEAWEGYF